MSRLERYDVIVLGAGPAGMAAALGAAGFGCSVLVIERESRPGGILKQCIHDGFGLIRYREKLSGPEYAWRDIQAMRQAGVGLCTNSFVSGIVAYREGFRLTCISQSGIDEYCCSALVLATGCRERSDRQVFIHGDRPSGIYTAGLAQAMVNLYGLLPGRRAVILGSGDIGLIMARRLYLEGTEVLGVFELRSEASGLERNIQQCLLDFSIPLHLSTTVTNVFGGQRVEAVETAVVGPDSRPIAGSERRMDCDCLIVSVGLIPENEIAASLGLPMDRRTGGPLVDQSMHSLVDGVFVCGNAVHVHDLVDYVSESAAMAGHSAAAYAQARRGGRPRERRLKRVETAGPFLYSVPQYLDLDADFPADCYFRSACTLHTGARLRCLSGSTQVCSSEFMHLRPPEMERFNLPSEVAGEGNIRLELEEDDSNG